MRRATARGLIGPMSGRQRAWLFGALATLVALVLLETPALEYVKPARLEAALQAVANHPLLPVLLLGAFMVSGAFFISVWLLIAQTALFYGPAVAIPLALCGALLSAMTFYGVGRLLGADAVHRFAPASVQRAVRGAGLETIITVRLVPVLPFTFVNVCAGAFHVEVGVFILGTALGLAPGIVMLSLLGDQFMALLRHPTPKAIAAAALGILVVGFGVAWLQRRARGKASPRD